MDDHHHENRSRRSARRAKIAGSAAPHRRVNGHAVEIGPRCLVTGGAGYLGNAIAHALTARGCAVNILDVNRPPSPPPGAILFHGDIRDAGLVRRAAAGCATVFHTAAVMTLLGMCRPAVRRRVFGINHEGTLAVIEACRAAGVGRLVYTSTNTVCYDDGPVCSGDESRPYARRFLDIYGESKMLAERAVLSADDPAGLRTTALRPAGIWGPGDGCFMIEKFTAALRAGRLSVTIGDGSSRTDNTHIDNLVSAQLLAAERLAATPAVVGGRAYFITDEEPINLWQFFRPLIEGLGHAVPRRAVPARLMYTLAWIMEAAHLLGGPYPAMTRLEVHNLTTDFIFRTDRARADLGYRPLVGHRDGMRRCLEDCRTRVCDASGARS